MSQKISIIYEKKDEIIHILSPAVGVIHDLPTPGQVLSTTQNSGTLQILSKYFSLKLPDGISGKVMEYDDGQKYFPVAYHQELFRLSPITHENETTENEIEEKQLNESGEYVIYAPSDGVFYRKPSPESPNYVTIGETVKTGQVLGLVEVMKCFNPIAFQGLNFPPQAKIKQICLEDGTEVKYQQPLFIFSN